MSKITHINLHSETDLDRLCSQETFPDYVRDEVNYFRYKRGCSLARKFVNSGKWSVDEDDPNEKLDYHSLHVKIIEDDFDPTELKDFVDLLSQFDSLMFFGDRTGDTSFVVGISNVYKPAE